MFFESLTSFFTMAALFGSLTLPTLGIILSYPFSKKISVKISDYIVHVCAPRLFRILHVYKHFTLSFSQEKKDELPEQFIIISNHQSLLDIPIYMTFLPGYELRFVAKDSLGRHVPMVSEMLRSHEHCLIPRKGGTSIAMKALENFGKRVIVKRQIPVIFPEGTRSSNGELKQFYSAGFRKISDAANLPVVVCVVDDGYKVNDLFHVMENLRNINYRVKILKIYPAPKNKAEQVAILEEAKLLMQCQLGEWRKD